MRCEGGAFTKTVRGPEAPDFLAEDQVAMTH